MLTKLVGLASVISFALSLGGFSTVSVYQSLISQFQVSVNGANDAIRPYLIGVNNLIAEGNLNDGGPAFVGRGRETTAYKFVGLYYPDK